MSKYIKLEDAIRKYAEMFADEAYWEHGVGNGKPDEEDLDIAREYYSDLPTIEISEDCISRDWVLNRLTKYQKDYTFNELDDWQNTVVEWITTDIKNAPSVVPRLDKEDLEDIKEHIAESYIEGYMDGHAEGEWINQEQGAFYPVECSNCHKQPLLNEDEDYEYTKYCPYCGAKMKV